MRFVMVKLTIRLCNVVVVVAVVVCEYGYAMHTFSIAVIKFSGIRAHSSFSIVSYMSLKGIPIV